MQKLPQLETCVRLAFEARDERAPCGVRLASYFVRAPTRGRRRSELPPSLLFPDKLRAQLGRSAESAFALALDPQAVRACAQPQAAVPLADREWLFLAAHALGAAEGSALAWALLDATAELERAASRLLGATRPRASVRRVLHGVGDRALRTEPFAALLVRVLQVAQAVYAACRCAGAAHEPAWAAVEDRLWAAHPTGRLLPSGGAARGPYLPSLVQAASGHGRRRMGRSLEQGRTRAHARALLARFSSGPGRAMWPWVDGDGLLLPERDKLPVPEAVAPCFFVLLTFAASWRRARGGPSRRLPLPYEEAGFGAADWLPDRTDDLAVRLLSAPEGAQRPQLVLTMPLLLRATLARDAPAEPAHPALSEPMLGRARERLPQVLRWLEENGRELLERS